MIELLTTAEMAEGDRLTIARGTAGIDLMERAGTAVAESIAARHPPGSRIAIVAGPGNNGGDGFVAARILAGQGYRVRVLLFGALERLRGDAALAAGRWGGPTEAATPAGLAAADVIVDALFGAGLDRPVEGPARALIAAINAAAGSCVHAIDLPSGINGTTGAVMGAAVKATRTVTFFRRKPAHLLLPGRLFCGEISTADIGIPASVLNHIKPQAFTNTPALWAKSFPIPGIDGHKYSRGHAVVFTGGRLSTGAGRLAARGALRAGAGLVTIASPDEALAINAAANLAVMVTSINNGEELAACLKDTRRNAIVLGPGGGAGVTMRELVHTTLQSNRAVVLDADALTSFADIEPLVAAIQARPAAATVLTPHEGEFSVLFKTIHAVAKGESKLERVRQAARHTGAVVLLKGADTVVGAPDGRASIAHNAPPWLATAGSGDVLAGIVAGLLAQGMPGFEAASAAVWLHGETGTEVGPGLIAEDLPEALPKVYRRLFAQISRS